MFVLPMKYIVILLLLFSGKNFAQNTWVTQTAPSLEALYGVYFIDASTGIACGSDGAIFHTTDGGKNWAEQTSGTNYRLQSVFMTSSTSATIVGRDGAILHTTNGGASWQAQESPSKLQPLLATFFLDSLNGYAAGWYGTIIHTADGGDHWHQQKCEVTTFLRSIYFHENTGLIVGEKGTLLRTTNSG